MQDIDVLEAMPVPELDFERKAGSAYTHEFHIRHPPKPHSLSKFLTTDEELFQTIHMGSVEVDKERWLLVVDGLVQRPFALSLKQLLRLQRSTVTAFHECFGSPLKPATDALWRIGNVAWTGVPLRAILDWAKPLPAAKFVWSEGLDSGVFAGVSANRYQKDLTMEKAMSPEVLVAYEMNGEPLNRERGGPVRLVVPGWFGTNSTKWLCKLSLREHRAPGPFTTTFYNIKDPDLADEKTIPVWNVDVNSMIVRPIPHNVLKGSELEIEGWAWSHDEVRRVEVSADSGKTWREACLRSRTGFSWQKFSLTLYLDPGSYVLMARATSSSGKTQVLSGRRNHVHSVPIEVTE